MAYRRTDTLDDLSESGFLLLVGCKSCGNMRSLKPSSLFARVSPARPWTALKFRCTRCGSRQVLAGIDPQSRR